MTTQLSVPLLSPVRFRSDATLFAAGAASSAVEAMAREALATCAPFLIVPPLSLAMRQFSGTLSKRDFSPSIRSRVTFADRRERVWDAVVAYLLPIQTAMRSHDPNSYAALDVALALYHLVLSTRAAAQVRLPLSMVLKRLDEIAAFQPPLAAELLARAAVLRGVFLSLRSSGSVPGLAIPAGQNVRFGDRLEEILEDAYLAEASEMRRFFGLQANLSAITRDLRKVLRAITRERTWARGVTEVAEQAIALPSAAARAVNAALEALGEGSVAHAPIVIDSSVDASGLLQGWTVALRELDPHDDRYKLLLQPE